MRGNSNKGVNTRAGIITVKDRIQLNIVSIVISALIVRIIGEWITTLQALARCQMADCEKELDKDFILFKFRSKSALLVTGFCGFLAILIITWYAQYLN